MLRYFIILLGHAFLCLTESSATDLPAPGLVQSRPNTPLLTDGESRVLLDLKMVLDQPRRLRSVKMDAGAGPGDLSSFALDLPGEWQPSAWDDGKITFTGEAPLPPGAHRLSLTGCAPPRLGLLARLHPRCVELRFADGTSMRPQEVALPPLRPAYPIHKRGQFQCHTFRIPAIARAMDGSLLAVYDMRYLSEKNQGIKTTPAAATFSPVLPPL